MRQEVRIPYDPPVGAATLARWRAELAAFSPPSESRTWLHLYWEPGDWWAPLQRWEIREMIPLALFAQAAARKRQRGIADADNYEASLIAECRGPSPRVFNYYDRELEQFVRTAPTTLSYRQWQLVQEFDCYSKRAWIVQGTTGGHPWMLSQLEERARRQAEHPELPSPGELPYADFDARVLHQLRRRERLEKGYAMLGLGAFANAKEAERALNAQLSKQIDDYYTDLVAEHKPRMGWASVLPARSLDRAEGKARDAMMDAHAERFIQTTTVT